MCVLPSFPQQVTVKGKDVSRAGKEIVFLTWSDQITFLKDTVCRCRIKTDGEFNCSFRISETQPVLIPLENRFAQFFADPGETYTARLPALKEISTGDILNPFREEETVYLNLVNTDDTELNLMIRRFELMYNDYVNSRFNEIYKLAKHSGVDTVIKILDTTFSYQGNQYFNDYKKYKIAMLRYFAYIRNDKYVTKEYFRNQPLLYHNPAYMSLFCQVYDNYFTYFSKSSEGSNVVMNISRQKSFRELKNTLAKNIALDDENLRELVALKGLHDAYLKGSFKKNELIQILDSAYLQTENPAHKKIALHIKSKILAPDRLNDLDPVILYGTDGTAHSFEKFRGKYVYLGFCNTRSFTCKEEFELVKKMLEKKDKPFEVVSVFIDDSAKSVKEFISKNHMKWPVFYTDSQAALIKGLKIKAYPAYYLLGPDGKIIISNTKTLKEGFEEFFIRTFGKNPE